MGSTTYIELQRLTRDMFGAEFAYLVICTWMGKGRYTGRGAGVRLPRLVGPHGGMACAVTTLTGLEPFLTTIRGMSTIQSMGKLPICNIYELGYQFSKQK